MDNYSQGLEGHSKSVTREFFRDVYTYMFIALGISGSIAYTFGTPEFFNQYILTAEGGISPFFWVAMLAPVGISFVITWGYQRLSFGLLMVLFVVYSSLMGLTLSTLFLRYELSEIYSTFFISAGAFAAMAVLGYTTKTDLTKMGSLLYMAFIGIFIAGIVNIFIGSSALGFAISCIGVFVFTGLTAYYMQNFKKIAQDSGMSSMDRSKFALVGGLTLYILFVNLFITLLRLLGGRD